MRTIIHIHFLPCKLGHFWWTHPDPTNFPRASWLGRPGSHPVSVGFRRDQHARPRREGPETLAKANTWQEHLVRPWRQLESSRGSGGHAELCRQRGGGRQGCPETPRRGEMPTDPSPRSPLGEGTPLYAAGDGQAPARGAGALTSTLPVPALRGADPFPGARTGSPHPAGAVPPSRCSLPNFPAPTAAGPPGRRPSTRRRARPSRAKGVPGPGGERAWAAPGPGRRSPGWLQSLGKMVPRLLLAQSISVRRSPGARGARAPRRGRTHLPAATCARREPPGKLCGPRGGGGRRRPPRPAAPRPHRRPPAHLPRRRAAAAAAARPPASAGPWLRFPGPRAAAPRGPGRPGRERAPRARGAGGSGEARRTHSRRHRAASRMSHPARAERGPGLRQRRARPT